MAFRTNDIFCLQTFRCLLQTNNYQRRAIETEVDKKTGHDQETVPLDCVQNTSEYFGIARNSKEIVKAFPE